MTSALYTSDARDENLHVLLINRANMISYLECGQYNVTFRI